MTDIHPSFHPILSHFFPEEILMYFTLTGMQESRSSKTGDVTLELCLEEKNVVPVLPPEHRDKRILSKGFHRPITLQHFQIQDKLCHLRILRRRWETAEGVTIERTLDCLPLRGLKLTTTFGDFLKEADRARTGGS
jgi:hypothetical protein